MVAGRVFFIIFAILETILERKENGIMTTMELEAKKASLVRDILTEVDDTEFLKKLQKAYDRVKNQVRKEKDTEYISKEEILAGIDAGLKEMKAGRMRPAEELLKELRNEL